MDSQHKAIIEVALRLLKDLIGDWHLVLYLEYGRTIVIKVRNKSRLRPRRLSGTLKEILFKLRELQT